MLKDLILRNRTYRRFDGKVTISEGDLLELIDLARISSSGANLQSLKYLLSCSKEMNNQIFKHIKWAGYLKEWSGPKEDERPSGYIIMCHDKSISSTYFWDHGIASQSIMLGATEMGYGGCMFGAFDKKGLEKEFNLSETLDVLMVLAIGKPIEEVVLEDLSADGSIKYYRDESQVHHVPKRALESMIIKLEKE